MRLSSAEKWTSVSPCKEAAATAALAEVEGIRSHLVLAQDNVRIKDAMLESQAELISSLKGEAMRAREAGSGRGLHSSTLLLNLSRV